MKIRVFIGGGFSFFLVVLGSSFTVVPLGRAWDFIGFVEVQQLDSCFVNIVPTAVWHALI